MIREVPPVFTIFGVALIFPEEIELIQTLAPSEQNCGDTHVVMVEV